MLAYELKEYIIENDKIEDILEALECHSIKLWAKEYRCGLPNHTNPTSIAIKRDSLKVRIYTNDDKVKGDIFTLVMTINNCSFSDALKELHKILKLSYTFNPKEKKEEKKDILKIFKKAMKKHRGDYETEKLEVYNEDICSEFIDIPYIEWVREGIMPYTQKEFKIGYSAAKNRVCIPHRFWCGTPHDFVGVMGRTLNENYDLLEIPKYFPLVKFPKSMNLYGLQENYEGIQKAGYVNVFESEKSTLKRHSLLDKTGVSLGGHEISDEQARILISLDVDIIIQMDKDIGINHVRSLCEKFYLYRNVYYVFDEFGLLKPKESPADKPNKVYNVLWNRKVKYDEAEHVKYVKWHKEQGKKEKNQYKNKN